MRVKLLLLSTYLTLLAAPAQAVVIGGEVFDIVGVSSTDAFEQGGTFIELTLPFNPPNGALNTVGNNTFQTPNLYAFDEDINVTFANNLNYEYGADSVRDQGANPATVAGDFIGGTNNKNAGTLLGGTSNVYASHYVFFDPNNSTRIHGRVDFDADIVAVFTSKNSLDASDVFLNNSVTYLSPGLRGLEGGDHPVDVVGSSLYVDFTASTPGDFIRVLTLESSGTPNTVPAPQGIVLLMLGLGLLVARFKSV